MSLLRFAPAEAPRASIVIVAWKQLEMLLSCLRSIAETISRAVEYEVIVVSNDASQHIRDALRAEAPGIRLVEANANLGFGGGCNLGASLARGDYIVLLNDDAIVAPGWLEWLVATADANPHAAAVGSLILFPDGRIQEAGSLIWADGSTMPAGRFVPGDSLEWRFVRRVDYVSACSLLVKRRAWEQIGGFDPEYHPAYYEDVDLCLSLRAHGYDVLFEPRSRVWHHESASSDSRFKRFLFARNQKRIQTKWAATLPYHEPPGSTRDDAIARAILRPEGKKPRILAVDDRVPDPSMGSGYGRMFDALIELAQDYAVSFYPVLTSPNLPADELVSAGIRIIQTDLRAHLSTPWVKYDIVIVSRPHNFDRVVSLVRNHQPRATLVYDCEALFWRRMERQAALMNEGLERRTLLAAAAEMRQLEDRIVSRTDFAVTVSSDEAQILQTVTMCCPIRSIRPAEPAISVGTEGFENRVGIAYVAGWMAGTTSPNADGLRWFHAEVLPLVRQAIPWIRVYVTGANPPEDLLSLADDNLFFTGNVADLARFYGERRVVMAPVRFGAGVKVKTIQALQYGVPVVATTCGAEGIDTFGLDAIAVADEPAAFAAAVVTLLTSKTAWEQRRRAIEALLARWRDGGKEESWSGVVSELLARRNRDGDAVLDSRRSR